MKNVAKPTEGPHFVARLQGSRAKRRQALNIFKAGTALLPWVGIH
jgi:hypothetical protein